MGDMKRALLSAWPSLLHGPRESAGSAHPEGLEAAVWLSTAGPPLGPVLQKLPRSGHHTLPLGLHLDSNQSYSSYSTSTPMSAWLPSVVKTSEACVRACPSALEMCHVCVAQSDDLVLVGTFQCKLPLHTGYHLSFICISALCA